MEYDLNSSIKERKNKNLKKIRLLSQNNLFENKIFFNNKFHPFIPKTKIIRLNNSNNYTLKLYKENNPKSHLNRNKSSLLLNNNNLLNFTFGKDKKDDNKKNNDIIINNYSFLPKLSIKKKVIFENKNLNFNNLDNINSDNNNLENNLNSTPGFNLILPEKIKNKKYNNNKSKFINYNSNNKKIYLKKNKFNIELKNNMSYLQNIYNKNFINKNIYQNNFSLKNNDRKKNIYFHKNNSLPKINIKKTLLKNLFIQ